MAYIGHGEALQWGFPCFRIVPILASGNSVPLPFGYWLSPRYCDWDWLAFLQENELLDFSIRQMRYTRLRFAHGRITVFNLIGRRGRFARSDDPSLCCCVRWRICAVYFKWIEGFPRKKSSCFPALVALGFLVAAFVYFGCSFFPPTTRIATVASLPCIAGLLVLWADGMSSGKRMEAFSGEELACEAEIERGSENAI